MRSGCRLVTAEDSPMQKTPKGQNRRANAVGNAVKGTPIATAEVEVDRDWNPATILGVLGGRASLSKKKRNKIAKKAAAKRCSAPS